MSTTAETPVLLYGMAHIAVRKVDTKSKNVAILYGRSRISINADNPLSPYSMAELIDLVKAFMADKLAIL